jgi:diguanylate cyclase (GGDEF)-like protein
VEVTVGWAGALGRRVRDALPRGGTLPPEEWDRRHRALLGFLWLNVIVLPLAGVASGDYNAGHNVLHLAPLLALAIIAGSHRIERKVRAVCVSLGLLTAAALLVHMTSGLIEAHFYFFVVIVALTAYEDWRPFLIAVAYVLLHHGVLGMIDPHSVFNRPEEYAEPWKWAAIHALFVAGAGVAAVIAWRLNENVRERMLAVQALLEDAALVDVLTELPNRRQLMIDLAEAIAKGESEPTMLALFDLDGFKSYNDAFGHAAGDALLTRLGRALSAAAPEPARAYRLGGDEFCILAPAAGLDLERFLTHAEDALCERGEGFSIGASYGVTMLPEESSERDQALQLADQRMYQQKTSGRLSAGRQIGDVLLQALQARHPDLGEHLGGVAELSETVASWLELDQADAERVRQAAELHDVGKVAIPDAILLKPGRLTDEEWEFMKRHTLIGERIVAAAPALRQVAGLIRSSHEWFDGTGYPDGLSGKDIPLGARIIGVCDAYDAMVTGRPYRPIAKTEAQALAELQRCAGTQFDPQVVHAFAVAIQDRAKAERHTGAASPNGVVHAPRRSLTSPI